MSPKDKQADRLRAESSLGEMSRAGGGEMMAQQKTLVAMAVLSSILINGKR